MSRRHVRTDEMAIEVKAYATVGTPHHDIASILKIGIKTLLKNYEDELREGKARGIAQVAKTLWTSATRGNNLGAQCFFLKCQGGWRETSIVQSQMLDKDGMPTDPPQLGISFEDGGPGQALKQPYADDKPEEPPLEPTGRAH